MINETWWDKTDDLQRTFKILTSFNFVSFRNDRNHRSPNEKSHGGCAIFVKNDIPVTRVHHFNSAQSEWLGVTIKGRKGNVLITTGYSTPEKPLDLSFLVDCFKSPCIFAGDLNCWHPLLSGDEIVNKSGNDLMSFVNESHSQILNGGQPMPTRFANGVGRQLDIWLCSQSLTSTACNVPSIGDKYGSDHYCTMTELNLSVSSSEPSTEGVATPVRFLFAKANWHRFRSSLANLLDKLHTPKTGDLTSCIDDYAKGIEQAILKAAKDTIPVGSSVDIPKWKMNAKIGAALASKNELERLRDRNPNVLWLKEAIYQAKLNVRRLIGAEIAIENNSLLRRLSAELDRNSHPSPASWRTISCKLGKKRRGRAIPCLKGNNGPINDESEKATAIGKTIAQMVAGAPSPPQLRGKTSQSNFWDQKEIEAASFHALASIPVTNTVIINSHSLTKLVSKLKFKAPGIDNIPNILIKRGGTILVKHLTNLFNLSVNSGRFPAHWKVAVVIPILKDGKDPSLPNSYRPVSLLPALGKLLETVMARFLQSKAEDMNLLPKHQAGFRRFRSTCDPIFRLINDISLAITDKKRLAAVLVDFKAAFDSVWHAGLLVKLADHLPIWFVRWVADWLQGRHFKAKVGTQYSPSFPIYSGTPQGSPLSPILFLFFISDLLPSNCMPTDATRSVAIGSYADDVALWAASANLLVIRNKLQTKLNSITMWCHKWRLAINPIKCECILFGYSGNRQPQLLLTIANNMIQQSKTCRYLGVTLTPRLCWDQHLNSISAKVKWRTGALRGLSRRANNLSVFWIDMVNTYIISVIRYASPAWFPYINDNCKKRLLRFQCEALCSALGRPPLNSEDDASTILAEANQLNILDILWNQCSSHWYKAATFNQTIRKYIINKAHDLLPNPPNLIIVHQHNAINEL